MPYEKDHLATPAEAIAEYARNIGAEFPDRAWLLHDWDVWVANPHYVGPPVPHPEDDSMEPWDTDGDTSKWNENGEASEAANDRYASRAYPGDAIDYDDECPF